MSEISKPVKTICVNYLCDKCSTGYMLPIGRKVFNSFTHKCNMCNHIQNLPNVYPLIRYE